MTNPNDSPNPWCTGMQRPGFALAKRIVAAFLLAALATYIPFVAFGVYILWVGGITPSPGNELAGLGAALVLVVAGPLCLLLAGIVGAFWGGYRVHLGRMAFGLMVVVSLVIAALFVLQFAGVLGL